VLIFNIYWSIYNYLIEKICLVNNIYIKNFEELKILLDTDLKIILLDHKNNFIGTLKISNAAKSFDISATNVLHNYFNNSTKLLFSIQLKF